MAAAEAHLRPLAGLAVSGDALRVLLNQTEHFGHGPRQTLPLARMFGNNGGQFQAFSRISRRETWRIPVPRIRDRLPGIEHRALPPAAQGHRPEGSSIALSPGQPRWDAFSQRPRRTPPRPLGHPRIQYGAGPGRTAPSTPDAFPTVGPVTAFQPSQAYPTWLISKLEVTAWVVGTEADFTETTASIIQSPVNH